MAQTTVTLSNFTYTSDRPEVGKIIATAKGAATPQVKLAGENANFFELGKDNVLRVKKATSSQPNTKWLDLVLESGGKQYTFMIVKDEFVRNRVIAHRGAWKNTGATENSIGALEHAIRLGCEGSEFDVHMSLDSILFVHHDHDVKGIHIEKTPSAELAKLRLPNGENLPTLESYLQAGLNQNRTKLILEIKPSDISTERGQALAKKVVEMVQTHKAQGWVDYISFDYEILLKVKELEPSAKVSYLKADKAPAAVAKDSMYGIDYNQNALQKKPDWIQKAHALGLTVNVWTVNEPEIMDWFLQRKADYITTNEPELLLEKVKDLPLKK
ncbi:MAG: glycerophosphodiester phosphodiesterase [Rufibacter sp.]